MRVLVIDDEPFVRDTLGEILRQQHHDVVVADDGISGLARFREGAFDLVMTDLAMPGMSGWQVAQAVKAARPQVPVVLVTGWGVEVQAGRAADARRRPRDDQALPVRGRPGGRRELPWSWRIRIGEGKDP